MSQSTLISPGLYVILHSKVVSSAKRSHSVGLFQPGQFRRWSANKVEREFAETALWRLYFGIYFVFFPHPADPEVIFFCHVSAGKCSEHWALTLSPGRALSQWGVLRHRRTPWSICTICPPWSHSCSKPWAGSSAHSYHCCQSEHSTRHSASLPLRSLCQLYIQPSHCGQLC